MKFAIIAAGEGSRLAAEGIASPKPLVEVGGEKLLDRLVRIFMDNGAEEIVVIGNAHTPEVSRHLEVLQDNFPLQFKIKNTPSSMHSFFEISSLLDDAPFCLTTVDTIFHESEFKNYINAFRQVVESGQADGLMGVTDYIDDEKPLYVETDKNMDITAFLDQSNSCRFISGGIYGLTPASIVTLKRCIARGESRMRNFQRALIADGQHLLAWPFSKVLDIDHKGDILKAEQFLSEKKH